MSRMQSYEESDTQTAAIISVTQADKENEHYRIAYSDRGFTNAQNSEEDGATP